MVNPETVNSSTDKLLEEDRKKYRQTILDSLYELTGGTSDEPVHPLKENKRQLLPKIIEDLQQELNAVENRVAELGIEIDAAEGPMRSYQQNYEIKQEEYKDRSEKIEEQDKYSDKLAKTDPTQKRNFDNLDRKAKADLLARVFEFEDIEEVEEPIRPVRYKIQTIEIPLEIERILLTHALNRAITYQGITDHNVAKAISEEVHNLKTIGEHFQDPRVADHLHDATFIAKYLHDREIYEIEDGTLLVDALIIKNNIIDAGGFMMQHDDCIVACEVKDAMGYGFQCFRIKPNLQIQLEGQAAAQLNKRKIDQGDRLTFVAHSNTQPKITKVVGNYPLKEFPEFDNTEIITTYLGKDESDRLIVGQKIAGEGYVNVLRTPYSHQTLLSQATAEAVSQFENLRPGDNLMFNTPLRWHRNQDDKSEARIIEEALKNGSISLESAIQVPKGFKMHNALYIGKGKARELVVAYHMKDDKYPRLFRIPHNLQGKIDKKNLQSGNRISFEAKEHIFQRMISAVKFKKTKSRKI